MRRRKREENKKLRDSELGGRVADVREIHHDIYFNGMFISRTSFSLLMNKTILLVHKY